MLDHLLPLIYREYEYFDEANKENFGYMIRRRARPVSTQVSLPSRTPPRPPRRTSNSLKINGGVASSCKLKRRRERANKDNEEERETKKQRTRSAIKDEEPIAKKKQLQPLGVKKQDVNEEQRQMKLVTPVRKIQEPTMSAKKMPKKIKKSTKHSKTKVTADSMQNKVIQVSKKATHKRIPLQDITHLYVNEHTRSSMYQQRERFKAGLSTSVAIRFF